MCRFDDATFAMDAKVARHKPRTLSVTPVLGDFTLRRFRVGARIHSMARRPALDKISSTLRPPPSAKTEARASGFQFRCPTCDGRMRRVRRTLAETMLYVAMYECHQCHMRRPEPRWYALYLGDYPRCPSCGTYRLTRLVARDKVEQMQKDFFNLVQYLWGANLYHCCYCRLQFYDVRKPVAPQSQGTVCVEPAAT
jgi:hypothetical protein